MQSKELAPAPESDTRIPADMWDRTNERSVINLVPAAVASAMIEASRREPDFFMMDERDLFKRLRGSNREPSAVDNRIRLLFWLEYDRAQENLGMINISNVFAGVCTRQYFYATYLANATKVAWMCTPPTSYMNKIEDCLDFGMDRMRDILEINPDGYPMAARVRLMELQAKIVSMMDMRRHGGFTQKIEQKSVNLQIATSEKQVRHVAMENSMEELDKRLKTLETQERSSMNQPDILVESRVVASD